MKRMIAILLLSTMLLALIACTDTNPSDNSGSSLPQENLQVIYLGIGTSYVFPTNNGRGVYVPRSVLNYYDFETEEKMVICAQSGCLHNAYSCVAYLGGADGFAEYRNQWYMIDENDTETIRISRTDPSSGERTTICTLSRGDADIILYNNCSFAYGHAYLTVSTQRILSDNSCENYSYLYRVNLETGEYEQIATTTGSKSFRVLGASEDSVMLEWHYLTEEPPSEEEYIAQYGENADYMQYVSAYYDEHAVTEFGRYDFSTQSYTSLADEKTDGYHYSVDPNICYDNLVIYLLGDDLMLYDLSDNTSRKLLTQENIVNYQLRDGKAFYIVYENEEYRIYYANLETGESTLHNNNGNTDYMHFTLAVETEDYFVGLYGGMEGQYWIKKTDFYNDNYSNVKRLT